MHNAQCPPVSLCKNKEKICKRCHIEEEWENVCPSSVKQSNKHVCGFSVKEKEG